MDRIIKNYSTHPFLKELGSYIIVECKNWIDPAGVSVIRELQSKIKEHRCISGIMLSKRGITGNDERDAWAFIRDSFRMEGIIILVVTEEDLDLIGMGENNCINILEKRYEDVKFM